MRTAVLLLVFVLLPSCCGQRPAWTPRACPPARNCPPAGNGPRARAGRPAAPLPYLALFAVVDGDDAEARYHAVLALGRHDSTVVRGRLRELAASDEPLTRNAAARALLALGERDAASTLIQNLHKDERTFVVTDAIHHLQAVFGTDRGYEPNRGYADQDEAQAAWIESFGEPLAPRRTPEELRKRTATDEAARVVRERLEAFASVEEDEGTQEGEAWTAASALWAATAEIAPSRDVRELALVREVFGAIAERFPEKADAWNNHALASLNTGAYGDAEASYGRALALRPDDAYLHNDLGILLEGLGRLEEAQAQYRRAIELDAEDDIWRANLADVLAKQGRRAEAIAAYRDAERLAPEKWHYHRLWIGRLTSDPSMSVARRRADPPALGR